MGDDNERIELVGGRVKFIRDGKLVDAGHLTVPIGFGGIFMRVPPIPRGTDELQIWTGDELIGIREFQARRQSGVLRYFSEKRR